MKFTLLAILGSFLIVIPMVNPSVYGLQLTGQNWSSDKYYQGDGGTVSLTLYNDVSLAQWYIKTVEIQFDWQVQSNYVYSTPVGQDIASGQSGTYNISFGIPSSASVGSHSYTIYYVGVFNDVHSISTGTIYVHDLYEKQYDSMLSSIQSQLNTASNYNSPTARSDISQAQSDFVQATTLASEGQFQSAINSLNSAQNMINQASSAEQSYNSNNYNSGGYSSNYNSNSYHSSFDLGTLILIIVLPVAIGGGIVFWMGKKKIKTRSQRSNKDRISAPRVEEEMRDAMHVASAEEVKAENVKNQNVTKEIPNTETKPTKSIEAKIKKERKPKKSKKEIEQDQNALEILKERLARGTITKPEYDELKKEFE